jgi:hypothetical protein
MIRFRELEVASMNRRCALLNPRILREPLLDLLQTLLEIRTQG